MGFPFEHGLHATLMAMRLADVLDVDSETSAQVYYGCLLMYSGCTTDAAIESEIFAGSLTENVTPVQFGHQNEIIRGVLRAVSPPDLPPHRRLYEIANRLPKAMRLQTSHFTALCEVASMLADRLSLPDTITQMFFYLTERWDGKSVLKRAKGQEIPEALRITHVAREACFQRVLGGDAHAMDVVRSRAAVGLDPSIVKTFVDNGSHVLGVSEEHGSVWEATLNAEPHPRLQLDSVGLDRALAAIGDFSDLVSPFLAGHSTGVAELAASAAAIAGFSQADVVRARRAGFVHDVGRVAVHPAIWQKTTPLNADEWEQVRLHAYQTERVMSHGSLLKGLAEAAGSHHERLDGSGYHRGTSAASLMPTARLLAAADAFRAMTEPRAHRPALAPDQAAQVLAEEAGAGRHDPGLVACVIEAAGQDVPSMERPAGLTERECEVVGLLARGLQTKQIARVLEISVKTADTHIQNAYRKLGVSTRASATLFAMEHGLVRSGKLPIP